MDDLRIEENIMSKEETYCRQLHEHYCEASRKTSESYVSNMRECCRNMDELKVEYDKRIDQIEDKLYVAIGVLAGIITWWFVH